MRYKLIVSHPGKYVKEAIEALGMSHHEFAVRTGMLDKTVSTLINGESNITYDIACKLAYFFDTEDVLWINLQNAYNKYLYELEQEKTLEEEWRIVSYFERDFINALYDEKLNFRNRDDIIEKLRRTFKVNSLLNLTSTDMFSFYRTSIEKELDVKQIVLRNAWITYAITKSSDQSCKEYNETDLKKGISIIKGLINLPLKDALCKLKEILNDVGVKILFLPYLKNSNISGFTKWLPNENAVLIVVNDHGKTLDKFWFNLFYELGHALNIKKRYITINNTDIKSEEEQADVFANNELINFSKYNQFVAARDYSISSIKRFAINNNIPIYIVIGRLQKDGIIEWNMFNEYKEKLSFNK